MAAQDEPEGVARDDRTTTASAPEGSLDAIIRDQLRLMERQLDLLGGAAPSSPRGSPEAGSPEIARPRAEPSFAAAAQTGAPAKEAAADPRARHEKVDLRSMTLIEDALTPRQADFVRAFTGEYSRLTRGSKEAMAARRGVFSDWINSLGFRRSLKEIIYPIVARRSEGARLWDVDGREYIDMAIGYGVNYLGNKPDFIAKALEAQLREGFHLGPQFDLTAEVAERICALTGAERVTFTNTGTEAVMTALRIARTVTGRDKIALFAGSYHGTFDGILAQAQGLDARPAAPGVTRAMVGDVVVLEYGAERSLEVIASMAGELAAVLVEPVQSRNPSLQPRAFLHRLRALTAASKTALIFDEIITGFRLGPGGAQAYFGVRADLCTYGKVLGGGMPIGVIGGAARFMDATDGGMWRFGDDSVPTQAVTFFGGTFCKHPLAMTAALAVVKRIADEGPSLQRAVNRRTARFAAAANGFFEAEQVPLRVRHCASFFRFESFGDYDAAIQPITIDLLFYLLLSKGIYTWERRICFFSTAHTDADAERVLEAIKASVAELRAGGFSFRDESSLAKARALAPRRLPMTPAQRGIYFLSQLPGGELAYHVTAVARIEGQLNADRIEHALQALVARHDALRTRFSVDADGPFQEVVAGATVTLIEKTIEGAAIDSAVRESIQPFDLAEPPLLRATLLRVADRDHVLVLDAHHLAADGMALDILWAELIAAHQGLPLPPVRAQYGAYVFREQERLASDAPALAADRRYWLDRFAGHVPRLELPADHPRGPRQSFRGAVLRDELDPARTSRLRALARDLSSTLFTVLLGSFYALLARLSGQDDIVIGTAVDHRDAFEFAATIGTFVRPLPLRNRVEPGVPFSQWIAQVKDSLLADMAHKGLPFDALVDALHLQGDISRNPLFDVMFVFEEAARREVRSEDLVLRQQDVDTGATTFDLTLSFVDEGESLRIELSYCPDIFEEGTARALIGHLVAVLDRVIADPAVKLGDIDLPGGAARPPAPRRAEAAPGPARGPAEEPLLSAADEALLAAWNNTQVEGEPRCVHHVIKEQAKRTPDAVAVIFEKERLTYRELDERANQLARRLRRQGVGLEGLVGICMERSLELVVALLGALKAGAAYVPLDASYPKERLAFMIRDARAAVLLTQPHLLAQMTELAQGTPVQSLDPSGGFAELSSERRDAPASGEGPSNAAYVIYTSGSTGSPKGAVIPHSALYNHMAWLQESFALTADESVIQKTPLSFDVSIWEFFWPLMVGARLIMAAPGGHLDSAYLVDLIKEHQANVIYFVASMLQVFLEHPGVEECRSLRHVFCGGEALPLSLEARFFALLPRPDLQNIYGPTETAIEVTWWTCRRDNPSGVVPIGCPIRNTQIHVLDERMRRVPVGEAGELYIGGENLGRAYLRRPDLTADRFVPSPFAREPGERLYRSGDLARWLPDGSIEFLGRIDHQVKLRGHRIELGEVEAVIGQHPAVREVVAVVREDAPGVKRLVAYVVPRPGGEVSAAEIRGACAQKLPDPMVPSFVVTLDSFPHTPNGKIDRQALPPPRGEAPAEGMVPPRDAMEARIARVLAEVVGQEQVSVHHHFFDELGATSFAMLRAASLLSRELGAKVPVVRFFEHPTVAALARALRGDAEAQPAQTTASERAQGRNAILRARRGDRK